MSVTKTERQVEQFDQEGYLRKKTELANMIRDLIVADAKPEDLQVIIDAIKSRKMKNESALVEKSDSFLRDLFPLPKMTRSILEPITQFLSAKDGMAFGRTARGYSQATFFALNNKYHGKQSELKPFIEKARKVLVQSTEEMRVEPDMVFILKERTKNLLKELLNKTRKEAALSLFKHLEVLNPKLFNESFIQEIIKDSSHSLNAKIDVESVNAMIRGESAIFILKICLVTGIDEDKISSITQTFNAYYPNLAAREGFDDNYEECSVLIFNLEVLVNKVFPVLLRILPPPALSSLLPGVTSEASSSSSSSSSSLTR